MPDKLPPFPGDDASLAHQLQRANMTGDPLGFGVAMLVRAVREVKGAVGALLASVAELRAAKGEPQPVPPDAMDRVARAIAERAATKLALAYPWAVGCALAATLTLGIGAGYWTGRHAQAAEARRVELGLAMALPAASAWLEIVRANPNGPAVSRTWAATGGEVAELRVWSRAPQAPEARR